MKKLCLVALSAFLVVLGVSQVQASVRFHSQVETGDCDGDCGESESNNKQSNETDSTEEGGNNEGDAS